MDIRRRAAALCLAGLLFIMISACQIGNKKPSQEPLTRPSESFLKYGETNETIVELTKVNNSVWVHTSYQEENGALIPTNGLIVLTDKSVVLIDTPWTDQQMVSLDKLIHEAFNGNITSALITHTHQHSLGGMGYLKKQKIPVSCLEVVAEAAKLKGFTVPDQVNEGDSAILKVDNTEFELYYPGEGATPDNTVVWIDKYNVLFGGCLIRQYGADSLGDTTASNISLWPETLEKVMVEYDDMEIIVPSQGQWGDKSLIDYTLELFEE